MEQGKNPGSLIPKTKIRFFFEFRNSHNDDDKTRLQNGIDHRVGRVSISYFIPRHLIFCCQLLLCNHYAASFIPQEGRTESSLMT